MIKMLLFAAITVMAALGFTSGSASADPPDVISVRQLLGTSDRGHPKIDDLLIDDDGQITDVIVVTLPAHDTPIERRRVPWSEVELYRGATGLAVSVDADALRQRPPFPGPVAGTLGGVHAVLASKLLAASVKDRLGNDVGTVEDVIVNVNGTVQTAVITTAQRENHVPWAQLTVR